MSNEIIARVQAGDKAAFGLLYDRYADALFGVISRIVSDPPLAEDTLQEAFLKIWRKIDQWDADKAALFTWMYTIARNTALDQVGRKQGRHSEQLSEALHLSSNADSHQQAEHSEVCQMLSDLDPKYREVVQYLYLNGWSQREMAKQTGIPLGTIKSRLAKAIQLLKHRYNTAEIATLLMIYSSLYYG